MQQLEVKAPEGLPDIFADKERVIQVFQICIDNAIKHSSTSVHININAKYIKGYLQFDVKDDGPGITKELQDKIFSMYYTQQLTDNEKKPLRLGNGLITM
jgi:signal transduction histidine kinase